MKPTHENVPDNKVHVANMGPTWVLSAPDGPHVGPKNLAIRGLMDYNRKWLWLCHLMARHAHGFIAVSYVYVSAQIYIWPMINGLCK